jgi:hypothetical protein
MYTIQRSFMCTVPILKYLLTWPTVPSRFSDRAILSRTCNGFGGVHWDKDRMVFMGYNKALVTVHQPISQSAAATTAPPLLAILLTCNPQTKSKKISPVYILKCNMKTRNHRTEILINTGSYLCAPYLIWGLYVRPNSLALCYPDQLSHPSTQHWKWQSQFGHPQSTALDPKT